MKYLILIITLLFTISKVSANGSPIDIRLFVECQNDSTHNVYIYLKNWTDKVVKLDMEEAQLISGVRLLNHREYLSRERNNEPIHKALVSPKESIQQHRASALKLSFNAEELKSVFLGKLESVYNLDKEKPYSIYYVMGYKYLINKNTYVNRTVHSTDVLPLQCFE